MKEGGPFHAKGYLKDYALRLEAQHKEGHDILCDLLCAAYAPAIYSRRFVSLPGLLLLMPDLL